LSVPDAVLTQIAAALPGGVVATTDPDQIFTDEQIAVYDGIIPKTPPLRYLIVYIDTGTLETLAACGQHDSAYVRWQTTSVAPDAGMARWLAERSRDGTVDTKPTAPGWSCGPIAHVYSQRPQRDETVAERPSVFQVDLYEVLATRA
jgi:hypothetical protein